MQDQFLNAVSQVAEVAAIEGTEVNVNHEQFMVDGNPVAPLGDDGLPQFVTLQYVETKIADKLHFVIPDSTTVVCHLLLKSGQSVIGQSHAPTAATFDERKCAEFALNHAMGKLFDFEQHALADRRAVLAGLIK